MLKTVHARHAGFVWSLAIGLFALIWAYWTSFVEMAERWETSAEYSHGYLVPLLALGLLWYRYDRLGMGKVRSPRLGLILMAVGVAGLFMAPSAFLKEWGFLPAGVTMVGAGLALRPAEFDAERFQPTWWGIPFLAGGIAMRLVAAKYYIGWFDHLSLIPCVAGIVLLTVGRHAVLWAWPSILFLVFMVPLPHTLEGMMRDPLRRIGTKASTFLMQTVGLPAVADGNRHEVLVGGLTHRIGVTEACSGLSMLMIFFALSAAMAVVIRRPIWEKAIVLLSALPIALVANVMRITVTGLMLYTLEDRNVYFGLGGFALIDMPGNQFAQTFFHDWAGWLMMPFALLLMWAELAILKRLIILEEETPLDVGMRKSALTATEVLSNSKNSNQPSEGVQTPASVGG